MAVLPILTWPDPRLAQTCAEVAVIDDAVRQLAQEMLETMYDAPGRGLAAPQVGVLARMFVMDVAWKEGQPAPLVCINPVVLWRSDEVATGPEVCLSIPGITATVARPSAIDLAWTDIGGGAQQARMTGMAAICALHELDHLDGIVTLDHLTPEAREAAFAAAGAA